MKKLLATLLLIPALAHSHDRRLSFCFADYMAATASLIWHTEYLPKTMLWPVAAPSRHFVLYMEDSIATRAESTFFCVVDERGRFAFSFTAKEGQQIEPLLQDLHGVITLEYDGKEKDIYRP